MYLHCRPLWPAGHTLVNIDVVLYLAISYDNVGSSDIACVLGQHLLEYDSMTDIAIRDTIVLYTNAPGNVLYGLIFFQNKLKYTRPTINRPHCWTHSTSMLMQVLVDCFCWSISHLEYALSRHSAKLFFSRLIIYVYRLWSYIFTRRKHMGKFGIDYMMPNFHWKLIITRTLFLRVNYAGVKELMFSHRRHYTMWCKIRTSIRRQILIMCQLKAVTKNTNLQRFSPTLLARNKILW